MAAVLSTRCRLGKITHLHCIIHLRVPMNKALHGNFSGHFKSVKGRTSQQLHFCWVKARST